MRRRGGATHFECTYHKKDSFSRAQTDRGVTETETRDKNKRETERDRHTLVLQARADAYKRGGKDIGYWPSETRKEPNGQKRRDGDRARQIVL